MSRTTREYFPVRRGGAWVGEASHEVNLGTDIDFDHDTTLSFGQYGTKTFEFAIWFVFDMPEFEADGYTPMRARLELTPSADANTQGAGLFRVGLLRANSAWSDATVFGFDDDTYPDTTLMPYPTSDSSDVIRADVVIFNSFLPNAIDYQTWTQGVPVTFGDYTFSDQPLENTTDPDAAGLFATSLLLASFIAMKPGQIGIVVDPYQLPATGVESIDFYGAGWNIENGGAYRGPKCVVEWEAPDSTASVPADIQARVGVPLAELVSVGINAGAELLALCATGPVSLGSIASDAGAEFGQVCTTSLAELITAPENTDAGATFSAVFTTGPVSFGTVALDAGSFFGTTNTTGPESFEPTAWDGGATLTATGSASLASLTATSDDAGSTLGG